MTSGHVTVGPGQHAARRKTVLVVGKHRGLLESGVEMLAHEGYEAVAVAFQDDPRPALADALDALPDGTVDVLVLGGAVHSTTRPEMTAAARRHSPDVSVVEHRGSLNLLFEEVLAVLRQDPR
jgi:NAD(P)-dependent dehydrogenase (short-subunit alcohol dehydrogenase family)